MIEQDVIGHLIDVERLAYDLLLDAQTEADKRKSAAREQAEQRYHAAYEKIISDLDAEDARERKECDGAREREYEAFTAHLNSINQDRTAFNDYLDSVYPGK